jgi:hypothetical protein
MTYPCGSQDEGSNNGRSSITATVTARIGHISRR